MKHHDVAKRIIENVGGADNIQNVWHCMTRLRFKLKNYELVNHEALMKEQAVVGTNHKNEQLQIVIGTNVNEYYETVASLLGMNTEDTSTESNEPTERKGIISTFMVLNNS
ncbi:PTS transporter subunit EIIB [Marinilactibacillus psychrotolerans]|uniref:PTS transporter subunit EIIB n=1 Tax=Marinilactibacillus psychrotolerans TaxID=191770 RepID=UPI00388946C9